MADDAVQAVQEEELLAAPVRGSADELLDAGAADHFGRMRHSAAHVMAEAVMRLFPGVQLGIGPAITDGFYYDFLLERALTPEDLAAIEAEMAKSIAADHTFKLQEHPFGDLRASLLKAEQALKVEIMDDLAANATASGLPAPSVTTYTHGEFQDLCRGPHVESTGKIGPYKLLSVAGAYWRGKSDRPALQRIYGTAWDTQEELEQFIWRREEMKKRDHRRLGVALDLFSFHDVSPGSAFWHPKGQLLWRTLEGAMRELQDARGYQEISTPIIVSKRLWEKSGHWDLYRENMFIIESEGEEFSLKPMNCPFHILIYKSQARSYRDLPLRMFEFGSVYRYEKSGVVHGLTRVRGMTQDDAHLFVTQEDMESELTSVLNFVLDLLRDYGLTDFYLELSTRDPENEKFVGSDAIWEAATSTLEKVATDSGLELVPDPGGAAFYGPKISVQARDAIGRTWQMSTIQLDFNLPDRFDIEYTASDGTKKRPVMIHRALFGSIERFFAVLTEHYAGHFPPWLAPVQVVGIPVADEFAPYLSDIIAQLKAKGVRATVDLSDDRMQKKIRNHTKDKVPFQLIAGGDDRDGGSVSFRYRDGTQVNGVLVKDAIEQIVSAIANKEQV